MTLGRTSDNKIKIKTDSPGIRAVECACCVGGCSCSFISIRGPLLNVLRETITGTCNGQSPTQWSGPSAFYSYLWLAEWYIQGATYEDEWGDTVTDIDYYFAIMYENNCFRMGGDTLVSSIIHSGEFSSIACNCTRGMICADTNFTINGISFPAYTEKFPPPNDRSPAPPVFVFS